jgi:hypothetical protein
MVVEERVPGIGHTLTVPGIGYTLTSCSTPFVYSAYSRRPGAERSERSLAP